MSLAGKFVIFQGGDGDDAFFQTGEIVEHVGVHALVKWDRLHGGGCPHDDAMVLVAVSEMAARPGEDAAWEFFATRAQLDAYKAHIGFSGDGDEEAGGEVVQLRPH